MIIIRITTLVAVAELTGIKRKRKRAKESVNHASCCCASERAELNRESKELKQAFEDNEA